MPDTPDVYEKTATVLLQHLLRGEPHFDLCLISQSGDCLDFDGCVDHATKVLTGLLRENIPTSAADPDTTYPLKAAEMMASYLTEHLRTCLADCPRGAEDWSGCPCIQSPERCHNRDADCWLQYFREQAGEGVR